MYDCTVCRDCVTAVTRPLKNNVQNSDDLVKTTMSLVLPVNCNLL